jgi:Mrp family chromosome partitioning ATPase
MDKGRAAQNLNQAKFNRRSIVSGNQQFSNHVLPDDLAEDSENVLPALNDYLAAPNPRGGPVSAAAYAAEHDDILQLFDAPTVKRGAAPAAKTSGKLLTMPVPEKGKSEPRQVVPLDEYQKQHAAQLREAPSAERQAQAPSSESRPESSAPQPLTGEYLAPPTNPSQRSQSRRATAKLDYYKKLAELQQMNLEFGRSIRAARNEANQKQRPEPRPELRKNAPPADGRQMLRQEPGHPLTTSFHVATKRAEQRKAPAPPAANQPTPHPLPANQQRVTARLDYNRLLELQRRYDETHPAAPTIEDRLAQQSFNRETVRDLPPPFQRETMRVAEPNRPRLPVREWQETPPTEAVARRTTETELEQRPASGLHRSSYEQLEAQLRQQPAAERVREVLLDPTRIDPHLIALSDFNPRAAKYFDQVAVSLISISYKRLCKRVLVASAQHGEGRTCVTLNLAGALARARQRVLVVDCDLANPSVLRLLGVDAPLGLSEAVHRGLGPNSAALRVQPAAFNILPTREKIQHTAELLASPRFHEMLQICEPDYDFILFDSSPLLESADANLLAGLTDATMLVIRPGMTTTQQMAKAVALFNEKDICGVVLNRVAK